MKRFAHSLYDNSDDASWEPLDVHLCAVAAQAGCFAESLGLSRWAEAAGLLHDIGKASNAFQAYIRGALLKVDHSTAGAREAVKRYGPQCGKLLAFTIAGHHAGLADGGDLAIRLKKSLEPYDGWEGETGMLPEMKELALPADFQKNPHYPGFHLAFLTRIIFSCLVDADFLQTEAFYASARGKSVSRSGYRKLPRLRDSLRGYMESIDRRSATNLNQQRTRILEHAMGKTALPPGLFTMTVPTGGGKTLASLSFALTHAIIHDLRRLIYVAPYTSIIEQTAQVFREALDTDEDILEHHSNFDFEPTGPETGEADADGRNRLRLATENWDAPIVVTTAVQFFESLFAARTGRCRKLHNIASSVIILDEVQTMPVGLLRPCMAALDELARNYRTSIVLCTATQPALRIMDGALPLNKLNQPQGFDIGPERELAPDPAGLYAALRRVRVEVLPAPVHDETIAARFRDQPQMLCIVNSRGHAKTLFELIRDQKGARHLTTLMCPVHRRAVLTSIKTDLRADRPVRLVATSLVEAGVDFSFPEVWRAETGLDSIAQAAGRCNREREIEFGRLVVFAPADHKLPWQFKANRNAAQFALKMDDPLGLAAISRYFEELYFNRGYAALDNVEIDGLPGIMPAIGRAGTRLDFPFASIAANFRMIDETMRPVIIPYDPEARRALAALRHADVPPVWALRLLQRYTVTIPETAWRKLVGIAIQAVNARFGDRFMELVNPALYDEETGLRWDDSLVMRVEDGIF